VVKPSVVKSSNTLHTFGKVGCTRLVTRFGPTITRLPTTFELHKVDLLRLRVTQGWRATTRIDRKR
jgi:hypothetical protein